MYMHEPVCNKLSFEMSHAIFYFPSFFRFPYFPADLETKILIFWYRWNSWVKPDLQVPSRSLSVGAPVEPRWGETGKPVFRLQLGPDPDLRISNGTSVILRSNLIRGYPQHDYRCPGLAVVEQNRAKPVFPDFPVPDPDFPVPDPEFPWSASPKAILRSAQTQEYPWLSHNCTPSWYSPFPQGMSL